MFGLQKLAKLQLFLKPPNAPFFAAHGETLCWYSCLSIEMLQTIVRQAVIFVCAARSSMGNHRGAAKRAEWLFGSHDQLGTGSAGHAVVAGAEGDAGRLVQANNAGTIVLFRVVGVPVVDCLSNKCNDGAKLLQSLLGGAHVITHLRAK